jgi:hypothetical protein
MLRASFSNYLRLQRLLLVSEWRQAIWQDRAESGREAGRGAASCHREFTRVQA